MYCLADIRQCYQYHRMHYCRRYTDRSVCMLVRLDIYRRGFRSHHRRRLYPHSWAGNCCCRPLCIGLHHCRQNQWYSYRRCLHIRQGRIVYRCISADRTVGIVPGHCTRFPPGKSHKNRHNHWGHIAYRCKLRRSCRLLIHHWIHQMHFLLNRVGP